MKYKNKENYQNDRPDAEKEIADKMRQTQEKARNIMQTSIEEAKKDAERIRKERLQQSDQEKEIHLKQHTETINNLVERICQMILTTDQEP